MKWRFDFGISSPVWPDYPLVGGGPTGDTTAAPAPVPEQKQSAKERRLAAASAAKAAKEQRAKERRAAGGAAFKMKCEAEDASRAAAEEAALVAALHAACAAAEAAAAANAAATAPPQQLMLGAPPPWLADCDGPGAKPARNAAQDEFDALHLLWHNTGLGGQRALFELHHCNNTPAQRNELIGLVKQAMERETEKKKAAQAGIAQRYREHNNDQQRLYVCACCGERNKEDTGNYTRVPLSAMEALRFNGSNKDVLRWRRIEAAHAVTEAESGLPYSCVFNFWPPPQRGVALPPSHDHFQLIPEFVDTEHPPAGSAEAPTHSAMLCGTCATAARARKRPQRCVAAHDFGTLLRLGVPPLTEVERTCIATCAACAESGGQPPLLARGFVRLKLLFLTTDFSAAGAEADPRLGLSFLNKKLESI